MSDLNEFLAAEIPGLLAAADLPICPECKVAVERDSLYRAYTPPGARWRYEHGCDHPQKYNVKPDGTVLLADSVEGRLEVAAYNAGVELSAVSDAIRKASLAANNVDESYVAMQERMRDFVDDRIQ